MNRKSFLSRILVGLGAFFGLSRAQARQVPGIFMVSTPDFCTCIAGPEQVTSFLVPALAEVNRIIEEVRKLSPEMRVMNIGWRNIPDKECNPDGYKGFFRVLFIHRDEPMPSAYTAHSCSPEQLMEDVIRAA